MNGQKRGMVLNGKTNRKPRLTSSRPLSSTTWLQFCGRPSWIILTLCRETLADQLRRDAVVRERDGERQRWERVVPLCDGGDDEALREWINAADDVPPDFRRDVASTVRMHIADVPAGCWDALRAVVAREYFLREYVTAIQQELQMIERRPHEQLTNFLRRFTKLPDTAYPPCGRSREAEEIVKTRDDGLKVKMTRGGFPTVGQAVECLLRLETDEAAYERLTGQKREEKKDILAELTKVVSQAKAPAPQPPIAEQQMSTELEKLKIELSQVKGQLARAEAKNKNGSGTRSNPAGGRASSPSAGLQCFQCGGPHFKRDCPKRPSRQRSSSGPRGGCFKYGGPHFARDCQAHWLATCFHHRLGRHKFRRRLQTVSGIHLRWQRRHRVSLML